MTLVAVLPGDVDTVPSGGNAYDRHVPDELRRTGVAAGSTPCPARWPHPDGDALVGCLPGAGVPVLGRLRARDGEGVGDPVPCDTGPPSRRGAD